MRPIRVGVVGAGAAAEGIHLPALARTRGVETLAIVDPSDGTRRIHEEEVFRAGQLSQSPRADPVRGRGHRRHPPPVSRPGHDRPAERRHSRAGREADGAYDGRVRRDDRARRNAPGHVWPSGCSAASRRRLRYTKDVLDSGMLGAIRSFDVREGMVFRWPVKSAAMFSPKCGGVLADIGIHVLDLLLWWFGDVPASNTGTMPRGGVRRYCVLESRHDSVASGGERN